MNIFAGFLFVTDRHFVILTKQPSKTICRETCLNHIEVPLKPYLISNFKRNFEDFYQQNQCFNSNTCLQKNRRKQRLFYKEKTKKIKTSKKYNQT